MGRLEVIVRELEDEKFDLEVSLKKFEEGIVLYKACKKELGKAEKKISILTDSLKEDDFKI